MSRDDLLVRMEGISKRFGTVQALKDVDFAVKRQEVMGLVGDNGCLLYTSPSPRDRQKSRMPSSA